MHPDYPATDIVDELSAPAIKEILQFDISGEVNSHSAMIELEQWGLLKSVGRGEDLTEKGEEVVKILKNK